MKKLFLIAVLLIFINSDITFASNWKQIDNGLFMDTDSITTYIDKLGFKQTDIRSYWTKELNDNGAYFTNYEKEYNKKISYTMTRALINCKQRKVAPKAVVIYDTEGNFIKKFNFPIYRSSWNNIIPDSRGDLFYNILCK